MHLEGFSLTGHGMHAYHVNSCCIRLMNYKTVGQLVTYIPLPCMPNFSLIASWPNTLLIQSNASSSKFNNQGQCTGGGLLPPVFWQ
jgi:hypothetical protein